MEIKGKNVIVTGGCGFIGSHLAKALLERDPAHLIVVDNMWLSEHGNHPIPKFGRGIKIFRQDIGNYKGMKMIMNALSIDIVFNLAVMPLPHSLEYPTENFNNNVRIVTTLLDLLREGKFKRLVHFSSSEVYGSCQTAPMKEDHQIKPSTAYAASKAACDMLVGAAYRVEKLGVITVRPFNNYGPGQNENTYAAVIPRTIRRLMDGLSAQVFGDGRQTRDYIYVDDTARAAIDILESGDQFLGQVFNVASGREIVIKNLIHSIASIYMGLAGDMNTQVEYCPPREGDIVRHVADTTKVETLIGFKPEISFDEGLRRTIEWRLNNRGV